MNEDTKSESMPHSTEQREPNSTTTSRATDDSGLQMLASAGLLTSLPTTTAASTLLGTLPSTLSSLPVTTTSSLGLLGSHPSGPSVPRSLLQPTTMSTYNLLQIQQKEHQLLLERELLLAQHQREIQRQYDMLFLQNAVEMRKQQEALELLRDVKPAPELAAAASEGSKSQTDAPVPAPSVKSSAVVAAKKRPLPGKASDGDDALNQSERQRSSSGTPPQVAHQAGTVTKPKSKKRIADLVAQAERAPPKKRLKAKKKKKNTDTPADKVEEVIHETNDRDVLSVPSRGRAYEPAGNKNFRELVKKYHDFYQEAESKTEKTAVIGFIVNEVHKAGGRFLRRHDCEFDLQEGVTWVELSAEEASRKTRDNLIRMCSAKKR
eukprot:CAMPEP_0168785724 /NCGR_PEP_ID=MMETSP0725-20121227/10900_1 /TAXON_ID=265536 /ORGANISM="Amphiprora sp., Strain CCMP467" /LENGTH=377 /DNA_ID=CAMNT_0008835843 /DNA_START=69 /DNA_END=1202 /DNA_ORIENTATION=+